MSDELADLKKGGLATVALGAVFMLGATIIQPPTVEESSVPFSSEVRVQEYIPLTDGLPQIIFIAGLGLLVVGSAITGGVPVQRREPDLAGQPSTTHHLA